MPSKCIICNSTRPNFNYPNGKQALYCGSCKLENMLDVETKTCITCNNVRSIFKHTN